MPPRQSKAEGVPIKLSVDLKRNLAGKKGLERSIQSHEEQGPTI